MSLLTDEDKKAIEGHFKLLEKDVNIYLKKDKEECETEAILNELSELTTKLKLHISIADENEMSPSLSIGETGRILFKGTPSGYEFSTLLTSIIDSGRNEAQLSDETKNFLDTLEDPLDIKVFVTPTCPHCPSSAVMAHRMAAYSSKVNADVIEANEFMELSRQYQVQGVPRTVINETYSVEGSQPESYLIEGLKKHLEQQS